MLDVNHDVVELSNLINLDVHVQEVIYIKEYIIIWKKLRYWLVLSNDLMQEFECYMTVYTCLAMLATISQVLFANFVENCPNNICVFYVFGEILY